MARKWSTVRGAGGVDWYCGAPDVLLPYAADEQARETVGEQVARAAEQGRRMLLCARKRPSSPAAVSGASGSGDACGAVVEDP